jgi:hypothetical protein
VYLDKGQQSPFDHIDFELDRNWQPVLFSLKQDAENGGFCCWTLQSMDVAQSWNSRGLHMKRPLIRMGIYWNVNQSDAGDGQVTRAGDQAEQQRPTFWGNELIM